VKKNPDPLEGLDAKGRAWILELVQRAGGDQEKVVRYLQSIGIGASRKKLRTIIAAAIAKKNPKPELEPEPAIYAQLREMEARFRAGDEKLAAMLERHKLERAEQRVKDRREKKPERDSKARFLKRARKEERRRRQRRTDNPTVSAEAVSNAVRGFEEFTGELAGKAELVGVPEPGETMFVLGELSEISYVTSKQGGGRVEYVHRFGRPRPKLLADPDGRALFIAGGKFKINDRGIVG
jgi:hypothetical protein